MYNSKQEVQNKINSIGYTGAFSPCFVSSHYAESYGVKQEGWYIVSNITHQIVTE